jgi:predicted TIM-barrel fold metal-dependent hydrolase
MAPDLTALDPTVLADPWIISVDDHVTAPPDLWTARVAARFRDRAPKVERDRVVTHLAGVHFTFERGATDGKWADFWMFEGAESPLLAVTNAAGFDVSTLQDLMRNGTALTYEEIAPSCWEQGARLAAMHDDHVEASLCFSNVVTAFCGQTFMRIGDRELGLQCLEVYNDWMIDEWCGGLGQGHLIPLTLIPLWDVNLAAKEVRRCAEKGAHAVSFCENPTELGLPSFYEASNYWDPFFTACEETETVINMHIGSSSKLPTTSDGAPYAVTSILMYENSMAAVLDLIFSGVLDRFPTLTVALSEGQIGWLPYLVNRADRVWADPHDGGTGIRISQPPSSYIPGRIYGCIFDDSTALHCRNLIGVDQIMAEVDFPHAAGRRRNDLTAADYPNMASFFGEMCDDAGLNEIERYKVFRGNAIKAFGLHRFGIKQ